MLDNAVNAIAKLKNLKAIHNLFVFTICMSSAVNAIAKLKNLKAIHNLAGQVFRWMKSKSSNCGKALHCHHHSACGDNGDVRK